MLFSLTTFSSQFVWGPLCWAIVASIALGSNLRRPLAIIMCIGHLYGVALYYSTSLTEYYLNGVSHSRPEFLYFWVYYVGFNIPWVVVPARMSLFPSNRALMLTKRGRQVLLYQNVVYVTKRLESELPERIQERTKPNQDGELKKRPRQRAA